MVVIVAKEQAQAAMSLLKAEGEQVFELGHIRAQKAGEAPTVVV
jgi:phosphoribosylformylglycinamidine cyclo-ligase